MNALLACTGAGAATVVYWTIAAAAAGRRRLTIGTLPPLLPALVAASAYAATAADRPISAVAASAGAAVAGVVDARTGSIFDPLTVTMFLIAAACAAIDGSLIDGAYGAAAVGGGLFLLHALSSGRGLGLGDVKLFAALGISLGVSSGLTALALAFVFGGVYGSWLLATGRARPGTAIRFGPFIAAGTFAAVFAPLGFRP
jgi:prepilin signal peptidase PulO-like enzyme (type II secretory pathway)